MLRDSVAVVVRTCVRAHTIIPLAMKTMRKSTYGFPFASQMGMGLLRVAGTFLGGGGRGGRGMQEGGGTQFFADHGGFTVPSFRICWGVIFRLSVIPPFRIWDEFSPFLCSVIPSFKIFGDFSPFHHFVFRYFGWFSAVPSFHRSNILWFPPSTIPSYHFIIPPFLRLLDARRAPFLHQPRYHKTCLGHCNRTSSLYSL